jgi:hypothetical protein
MSILKEFINVSGNETIAMSFQLFWVIFFYNEYISFSNALIFYPYIAFALVVLPFFHIIRTRPIIFYASVIQLYAGTHALLSVFLRRRVAWVATGSKHTQISPAFKQTMFGVGIYLAVYLFLTLIAALVGFIHLFDISYYSVQFWLFYNIALSVILFSQMYKFYRTSVVTVSK